MQRLKLVGKVFGELVVVSPATRTFRKGRGQSYWLCRCSCGAFCKQTGYRLNNGSVTMCPSCRNKTRGLRRRLPCNQGDINSLFYKYSYRAKGRNMPFTLTKVQFAKLISRDCFYCGQHPRQKVSAHSLLTYNGLDRVDNQKGYTSTNCVPCCAQCNLAKHKHSLSDFKNWIQKVYERTIKHERPGSERE